MMIMMTISVSDSVGSVTYDSSVIRRAGAV